MHKKLAADLTSLAHRILQLKNKEDVLELKEVAYEVYEKLTVLAYVDEYIETTPNAKESKKDLLDKIEAADKEVKKEEVVELKPKAFEEEVVEDKPEEKEIIESEEVVIELEETIEEEKEVEEILEQPFDELEQTLFSFEEKEEKSALTLEEELDDTISVDIAADLFEKVEASKSLNDKLQQNLQIGLNDRIAFVKHLFEGNQEDFNRVVSQINTLKTLKEAKKFINKMVKPDYNWKDQETYEERFMTLVERKFN